MRSMNSAIIAGVLTLALGVLATSDAIAQKALVVTPDGNVGLGNPRPRHPCM